MTEKSTSICTILIIILIILIIILVVTPYIGKISYHKLDYHWFKNHTLLEIYNISSKHKNAFTSKIINANRLPISTEGIEFSFNLWMYIDNWDYRNFEKKSILEWVDASGRGFSLIISDLIFGIIIQQDLCLNPSIDYKLSYNGKDYEEIDEEKINPDQTKMSTFTGVRQLIGKEFDGVIDTNNYDNIPELPLQKWLHLAINLEQNRLDLFINNKMYVSKNLQFVPNLKKNTLTICKGGGYDGFINRVEYYNKILTLNEIEYKFKRGPVTHNFFKQIYGSLKKNKILDK